nr:sodium:proton antiporter [Lachnospiraceae bacterium]
MNIAEAYRALYTVALIILAILIGIMLIRAVKGPRVTDRILSVNMIGTMVISSILILSQMLGENYLIDVALIYA